MTRSIGKDEKGRQKRTAREIDFVVSKGGRKVYIQSAYAMENPEKISAEMKPFALTGDSFLKIAVRHDVRKRWYDDSGVLNIGIIDFLLDGSLF